MQISGLSGGASAWAVRDLFPQPQQQAQNVPSARQQMPSGAKTQGVSGAQMSSDMMMQLLNMQSGSASDAATHMISALDTDGDGALSLTEASANGGDKAADAFAALDTDGDGSLTSTELSSALEQMGPPSGGGAHGGPPPGGPPPGGPPPSSSDVASSLLSNIDNDEDGSLSLSEVGSALGEDAGSETSSAFSSLDTDGDGKLSLAELTSALDKYLQSDASRFAAQATNAATI